MFKWTVCVAAGGLVGAVAYVLLVPSPHGVPSAEREAALAAARRLPAAARESATMGMINTGLNANDLEFVAEMLDTLDSERALRRAAGMMHDRLRRVDPDLADHYLELVGR